MVKVSVIMSSCNHSAFIKNAIDSILNQTYKNIEFGRRIRRRDLEDLRVLRAGIRQGQGERVGTNAP